MMNELGRLVRRLKRMYAGFWLSAVLLVAVGECFDGWTGGWAGQELGVYAGESVVILLTALCVPLSLKSFVWWKRRFMDTANLPVALQACFRGYLLRLMLLAIPLWGGLLLYYLSWSTKGVLCAAIALVASLFCWPSENRLRRELDMDGDDFGRKGESQ